MKLVGHKCVGSAVTQAARYKPYDPQNLHVNPIRIVVQTAYSENVKYVYIVDFQKSKSICFAKLLLARKLEVAQTLRYRYFHANRISTKGFLFSEEIPVIRLK